MVEMAFSIRKATLADVPALSQLIRDSVWGLALQDYSKEQIEAALGSAWGVDTELIQDGTYFVVEAGARIVACGGWGRRKTLFGGDQQSDRESVLLNPAKEAARIRAFFVHPDWARRGIGRVLLEKCESEAREAGFQSGELVATLPGQRLYRTLGYSGEKRVSYPLPNGLQIDFVPMRKDRL